MVRQGLPPQPFVAVNDVYALLKIPIGSFDTPARVALERTPRASGRHARWRRRSGPAMEALLALNNTAPSDADRIAILDKAVEWMRKPGLSAIRR